MKNVFRYEIKIRAVLAVAACVVVALFLIAVSPATASAAGTIVVISQAAPEGPDPFQFSATGQITQNFSLVDNGVAGTNTQTLNNVPAGLTTITRGSTYLYDLTSVGCSVTGAGGSNASPNVPAGLVNIDLFDGDIVTCTFFNSVALPIVNSTADTGNAEDCGSGIGVCTLRGAILFANEDPFLGSYRIKFNIPITDPGYDPVAENYTINLLTALPIINSNITIAGRGAKRLTVRRQSPGSFAVFRIAPDRTVGISGVTITGGFSGFGGGIENRGTLTLTNSIVTGNQVTAFGGGIFNFNGGTLTLENSTVSGNSAVADGGGIANGGTTTLKNSTVSGNSTTNVGGGIRNLSMITIENSTISNNQAGVANGGISSTGIATLMNTIIANNTNGDCGTDGSINASFSLIEGGLGCVNGTNLNNQIGDPQLGPLQDNGGPTFTHALLAGSSAIDAGNSTLTTDQRGLLRPVDDPASPNGVGNLADIGAFEVQLPFVADADGDGVLDDVDRCLGTVLPEPRPAQLKKNRFYADASGNFIDAANTLSGITVADTGGCSGRQIIDLVGLGDGHRKYGITRSALLDWIAAGL